ncbi:MAG: hypothetical protein KIA12_05325 [Varibaculum cambriense]|uniref:general stress protein n=1 Tax=Varibaculum cambriense TaxID=184870 RepID=UPI00241CE9E7|nr:general stress protein [Varibaculum cambriense]MBS5972898.1 hypothetical protein [Varibaculum cambriense]
MAFPRNRMVNAALQGQDLAIFSSKEDVEEAINYLKSKDFPVQQLLVQERGLTRSNQVVGIVTWPKALLAGFSHGLMMGIFFALLFVLWKPSWAVFAPLVIAAFALLTAIERLVAWALRSSGSGYPIAYASSLTGQEHVLMTAADYYIARRHLLDDSRFQAAVVEQDAPSSVDDGPTQFGSRLDERPRFGVRLSPKARKQLRAQQTQVNEQRPATGSGSPEVAAPQTSTPDTKDLSGQPTQGQTGQAEPENSELNDAH